MWWYWRGDDITRNLISHSGASSLITSDDPVEVETLAADLAVLFDVTTFVAESSFALGERVQTYVPLPNDLAFPYLNVYYVQRTEGY